MEQIYCSVSEIIEDMGETGISESAVMSKIAAASLDIFGMMGQFLPTAETRSFPTADMVYEDPDRWDLLMLQDLLTITSVSVMGIPRSTNDYFGWPPLRSWPDGPYGALQINRFGSLGRWSPLSGKNAITGTWGMYDKTVSLQIAAVNQTNIATTIVVSDGSQISPGMVLELESEWELVTSTGAVTASTATVSGAWDNAAEELAVSDGTKVNVGETIKIDFEQMRVLDISGNTLLVARGVNKSKRNTHTNGTAVNVFRTFNVLRGANYSTATAHTSVSVARQVAPADVNYLCRQVAILMINKAKTGFAGRGGNDELGTGFWVNEFPRTQIEKIQANYPWCGQ